MVGAALFLCVVASEESPDYVVSQVRDAWRIYNACTPEIGFDTVGKPHPAAEQYGHQVHNELEQPLLQGLPHPADPLMPASFSPAAIRAWLTASAMPLVTKA